MFPSLRKGRIESVWPCWPDSVFAAVLVPIVTSATTVVTATGTSSWLAPWRHFFGLILFLSVCFSFFPLLFFCLSICSPSLLHHSSKCQSLPLISFSLCQFVFILTAPLPLCITYRSISLFLSDSESPHYFPCLYASYSFCPLPVSKPLNLFSPLSLPFFCSLHFKLFLLLCSTSI